MRRDHANDRRHDKTVSRGELIQPAEYPHALRTNTDLFVAFAQRGFDHVGVARIDSPAGKSNLTFVGAEMIGALGEHQIIPVQALLNRDEHRSRLVTVARKRLRRTEF
jgi:hypothetical protein